MRKLWLVVVLGWFIPITTLAAWAEPLCDPAVDPTLCNISAPLNVSSSDQTKDGGLIIGGSLMVNGLTTLDTLVVNGVSSTFNSLAIFNNGIDVNGINIANTFNYAGLAINFVVTANSIDDTEVSNTLTASNYVGTGSTSNSVDLATSEVFGVLPATSVDDVWVNITGDTMTGTLTFAPTSSVDAVSITPYANQEAIYITGASTQPLVSLNPTGTGLGLYVNSSVGYPIYVDATASATRGVNVVNSATGGYGVYSVASSATGGTGVFGSGITYGVFGRSTSGRGINGFSNTGYGGYFSSGTTSGSALYADLTSASTTTSSKALEVVGKNGYGGYFTADGDQSTALYAENTNNTAGFSKYGIQTTATTPAGIGIAATSDYGIAGQFNSSAGGTAISTNVSDFGIALDANGGVIDDVAAYNGGQFYPNEQPSTAVFSNEKIQIVNTESLSGDATDMFFDGDSLWTANNYSIFGTPYVRYNQHGLSDGHIIDYLSLWYGDTLEINMAGDTVYFFTDSADYYTKNRFDGSESSGSLTSSITINSSAFDGEDMWFGTNNNIYQWDNLSTLASRASGLGVIVDMIYANGYLWAVDSSNDVVYKMDTSSYSRTAISVGDNPQAIVFDGQSLWVANYNDNTLTRIDISTSGTTTYSVSSAGSNPQALTFDGSNVWIGYDNTTGVAAFNIAQETITRSSQLSGTSVAKLAFDGTYIWAGTENSNLLQIAAGTGFGENSDPIVDGVLMYNTSGSVRCLYVSGTTVTASATLTNCQ